MYKQIQEPAWREKRSGRGESEKKVRAKEPDVTYRTTVRAVTQYYSCSTSLRITMEKWTFSFLFVLFSALPDRKQRKYGWECLAVTKLDQ